MEAERDDARTGARLDELAALIASSPHNLVARSERPVVKERHIDEATRLAAALPLRSGDRWLDLGTGGGLPGLVLAVQRPDVCFTLLDSVAKKTRAVADFAARLGLDNVDVRHGRAEDVAWEDVHRGRHDGVVTRAVGPMPVVLELARGFVRDGGAVCVVKGPAVHAEVERSRAARHVLRLADVRVGELSGTERPTFLATMIARGAPPRGYPRRPGVPKSHPIGRHAASAG